MCVYWILWNRFHLWKHTRLTVLESCSDVSYLVSSAEIDAFVCSTADHPHIVVTG